MQLEFEELIVLRGVVEDELEVGTKVREDALEAEDDADLGNVLELVDREVVLRSIHEKIQLDIKGGGDDRN